MAADAKKRMAHYFKDENGKEVVREWLDELRKKKKHPAVALIEKRIIRAEQGNFGDHKFFGGIGEIKIDFGPGYRVYFGIDDRENLIILVNGGDKAQQQDDINLAQKYWKQYLDNSKE